MSSTTLPLPSRHRFSKGACHPIYQRMPTSVRHPPTRGIAYIKAGQNVRPPCYLFPRRSALPRAGWGKHARLSSALPERVPTLQSPRGRSGSAEHPPAVPERALPGDGTAGTENHRPRSAARSSRPSQHSPFIWSFLSFPRDPAGKIFFSSPVIAASSPLCSISFTSLLRKEAAGAQGVVGSSCHIPVSIWAKRDGG